MKRSLLHLLIATFALISLVAGPTKAQDQKIPDETGHLYLGNGLSLAAIKPRLLTANANVAEFLYSPNGARIAYVTQHANGNETDTSLAIVGTQSGETKVYVTGTFVTSNQDSQLAPGSLQVQGLGGWSADAHYLSFNAMVPANLPGTVSSTLFQQIGYVDLVRGAVSYVSFPPEALVAPPADPNAPVTAANTDQAGSGKLLVAEMMQSSWSPGDNLLAFTTAADFQGRPGVHSLCLFDPARQNTRVLQTESLPDTTYLSLVGWLDSHRIAYRAGKETFIYDLSTGKSEPSAQPIALLRGSVNPSIGPLMTVPAEDKQTIGVSASHQPVTAEAVSYGQTTSIWIQRQSGPAKQNRLLVDVFRGPQPLGWDPGDQSSAQFAPNAGFDRQGKYQVAYIAQGDLKVCDLAVRGASLMEQAIGGEKLACNQQEMLALTNAKQIGLAILEYTQDYDEHFPKGDGFSDSVAPYLSPDVPLDLPNIAPFHYVEPQNLSLADNDNPADTPIGTYDLPCGVVTVYMDGHAKVSQKPPAGG